MLTHLLSSALRSFWRYRFATAINLLALSLGLLCFVAACGIVIFLGSNDRAIPGSDRVYAVTEQVLDPRGGSFTGVLPATADPVARYLKTDFPALAVGRLRGGAEKSVTADGRSFFFGCGFVDPDFGKIFNMPFLSGDPAAAFAKPRSVVLSEDAAKKLFGGKAALGKIITIGGIDVTVTGVMGAIPQPTEFGGGMMSLVPSDLLATIDVGDSLDPPIPEPRAWRNIGTYTYIRLPSAAAAEGFLQAMPAFAARHLPQDMRIRIKFGAVPLRAVYRTFLDAMLRMDKTGASVGDLFLLLGLLVLGVACLNYANLAAAQAHDRLREAGMRKLLGATRSQILGQLLLETGLLALASLVIVLAGITLAAPLFDRQFGLDLSALLFGRAEFWLLLAAGVLAATFGAGLYPALLLSGNPAISAVQGGRVRRTSRLLPTILVGLQFMAASFLLISVIVISRQNDMLRRVAAPTPSDTLVVISTPLDTARISLQSLRDGLRGFAGIRSITAANSAPWSGDTETGSVERTPSETGHGIDDFETEVADDFFQTVGATVLAGRVFDQAHAGDLEPRKALEAGLAVAPFNVVIDRSLAASLGWTPQDAVGKTIWRFTVARLLPLHVIGVVEDRPLHLFGMGAHGNLYKYAPEFVFFPIIRVARSAEGPALAAIDDVIKKLAPKNPLKREFASDLFDQGASMFNIVSNVFGILAVFAFIIAIMGLIGMAIHVTSRRTHEIGVRKALGATARNILTLLLWDFSKPVAIAALASWPIAYLAVSAYLTLFVERASLTATPFILSLLITLAVAWTAVGWQAMRAAWLNPARILRYE